MIKNEKGNAMIFAIIGLATLFIITMVFTFLGNSNIKHATHEEQKTQAYYVAKTGAETLVKHAENSTNIKDTLDDLVTRTSTTPSEGDFNGEKFEVVVTKPDPLESIYHIKSTAIVKETKDWTTAIVNLDEGIVFPQFDGTIFSQDGIVIKDLNKLKGQNLKLYTSKVKPKNAENVIKITEPVGILDLFLSENDRWGKMGGQTPGASLDDQIVKIGTDEYSLKLAETFLNGNTKKDILYKNGIATVELHYEYDMREVFKDELLKHDQQLAKYFGVPYEAGSFSTNNAVINENINHTIFAVRGWTIDANATANREPLEIRVKDISILGNSVIKTSKHRDIIIITDDFTMEDGIELDVQGDGQLSILVAKNMQLDSNAKINISPKVTLDIHLKPGVYFKLNDKSSINGGSILGLGATIDLHGHSIFKGQVINETIGINDQAFINSFTEDEINNKNNKEPKVYVEWKR